MKTWICAKCYTRTVGDAPGTCPSCNGTELVPADSPRGVVMAEQANSSAAIAQKRANRGKLSLGDTGTQVIILVVVVVGVFVLVATNWP